MKALTVRQPYADAIAWNAKPVENRTKPLPAKYVGVPVMLHAAKALHASRLAATDLAAITGGQDYDGWIDTRSAVLAVIRFKGCHQADGSVHWCCRPWGQVPTAQHPNVWHWEIDDVTRLGEPVPVKGALGFWTPSDDVLAAVQQQVRLAATA
jgi:hypothetical protein